jgi:hypothetical protein
MKKVSAKWPQCAQVPTHPLNPHHQKSYKPRHKPPHRKDLRICHETGLSQQDTGTKYPRVRRHSTPSPVKTPNRDGSPAGIEEAGRPCTIPDGIPHGGVSRPSSFLILSGDREAILLGYPGRGMTVRQDLFLHCNNPEDSSILEERDLSPASGEHNADSPCEDRIAVFNVVFIQGGYRIARHSGITKEALINSRIEVLAAGFDLALQLFIPGRDHHPGHCHPCTQGDASRLPGRNR